jgi:two-component system, OmpR family, sensor histidine kinase KdpD
MQNPDHLSDTNAHRLPREEELLRVLEELYGGYAEAEEALTAIRRGEVDAFLVSTDEGEKVYTLKTAEHPYRVLIEQMREGAATISADGTILFCNRSLARLLNVPLERLMGESIHAFIAPSSAASFRRMLEVGDHSGSAGEGTLKAYGGADVPVHLSVKALPMDGIRVFSLVATDLTERKRAEEMLQRAYDDLEDRVVERTAELARANDLLQVTTEELLAANEELQQQAGELQRLNRELQKSEERFRLLTENASDLVILLDAGGTISYVSPSVKRVGGYAPEELIGRSSLELVHPDDAPRVMEALRTAATRPEERVSLEMRLLHTSGKWLTFDVIGVNLLSEEAVRGYVVNARDVTERKRVEELSQRQNRQLTVLNSIIGIAASSFALDDILSESLDTMLSLIEFDMGGIYLLDRERKTAVLQHHRYVPEFYLMQKRAVNVHHYPYNYVFAAGQPRYIESAGEVSPLEEDLLAELGASSVALIPLTAESAVVGALVAASTTERKISKENRRLLEAIGREIGVGILRGMLYQRLEAANREANLYLDILTHDIRNADNVANAYADILAETLEGEPQAHAQKLKASIRKSIEILANVATFRRIHQEKPDLKPVDLHQVIRRELDHFPDTPIRYEGMPRAVWADDLLPEVFTNLIGNAVKYGGPDVQVTVTVDDAEEDDEAVIVTVADTGPGVPDKMKEAIFDRFEREKGRGSGQGLGLSICRMLVERYGGRIWVEDRIPGRPEEGASFRFMLREVVHHD